VAAPSVRPVAYPKRVRSSQTTTDSAPALQEASAEPQQVVQVPTAGKDLQEEKERTMKLTDEERAARKKCACGTLLRKDNSDGVCKECRKAAKKAASRSGDAAPARPRKSKGSPPRNSVSRSAPKPNGVATLCVTEQHLDTFWSRLSLDEKTNLFQRQLDGV